MSGGEQQRIAIARALVRRPRVILADEPTGALDPDTGRAVMTLLEEVARESDSALIVITHDMAVAARASRAYELYDGVLHEVTDPGTLTQRAEAGNSSVDNTGTGGSAGIPGNPWDEASAASAGPQPPPPPAQVPAPPSGGSPDDTGVTARQTMRAVRRAAARQRESEQ